MGEKIVKKKYFLLSIICLLPALEIVLAFDWRTAFIGEFSYQVVTTTISLALVFILLCFLHELQINKKNRHTNIPFWAAYIFMTAFIIYFGEGIRCPDCGIGAYLLALFLPVLSLFVIGAAIAGYFIGWVVELLIQKKTKNRTTKKKSLI